MIRRATVTVVTLTVVTLTVVTLTVALLSAPNAFAQPPERAPAVKQRTPPKSKPAASPPRGRKAQPAFMPDVARRKPAQPRPVRARRPPPKDDGEDVVPRLDTDPFKPPPDKYGPRKKPHKFRPWFVRPSFGFVARFSPDRSYVPKEGFGFGLQAGVTLGRSVVKVALSLNYNFYRVARTVNIEVGGSNLTSCGEVRHLSFHMATASALGIAVFSKLEIWAGLRGGFAYAQLRTPTSTAEEECGTEEANKPTGALGPEAGIGVNIRNDLLLGVGLAYLHFFSKQTHDDTYLSQTHRLFYGVLTAEVNITLRF